MKPVRIISAAILFILIVCSSFSQDTSWRSQSVNGLFTVKLPRGFTSDKMDFIYVYEGEKDNMVFGIQYFDSLFHAVNDSDDYRIALTGFVEGKTSDPSMSTYDILVKDTIIAGMPGVMANLATSDTVHRYKQAFLFVVMINNRYCCFYYYSTKPGGREKSADYFLSSISFPNINIRERKYRLEPLMLLKTAR